MEPLRDMGAHEVSEAHIGAVEGQQTSGRRLASLDEEQDPD
jgi:hypothetical protein